jgi:hypothetical protein
MKSDIHADNEDPHTLVPFNQKSSMVNQENRPRREVNLITIISSEERKTTCLS